MLSFIKTFSSKLALRNRLSIHAQLLLTVKKKRPNFLILLVEGNINLLFVSLLNKSGSPFNIINVAIISYSTTIRGVSKLIFCHVRIFHSLKKGKIFSS